MTELRLSEIPASEQSLLLAIGALRVRAWAERSSELAAQDLFLDEFDPIGRHYGVFADQQLVAAARFSVHLDLTEAPDPEDFLDTPPLPAPIASLNRLVVAPGYRGLGLRARLVEARLAEAAQLGCRSAVTSVWPDERSLRRMERLGFICNGLTRIYTSMKYGQGARFMVMSRALSAK